MDLKEFLNQQNNVFSVKVSPNASRNRIKLENKADGSTILKIFVTQTAENGKANEAVITLLAKELKISKSCIEIIHGFTDKNKILRIECLD